MADGIVNRSQYLVERLGADEAESLDLNFAYHRNPPYLGNSAPNIGRPLFDCSLVASSWFPVPDQKAVLDVKNVSCNPVHCLKTRKSTVDNYNLSVGNDCARFVIESRWESFDQIEQPIAV